MTVQEVFEFYGKENVAKNNKTIREQLESKLKKQYVKGTSDLWLVTFI